MATTFFTDADVEFLRNIANLMVKSGVHVDQWMLNLKAATSKRWKELEKRPLKRKTISTEMNKNTNKRFAKLIEKDAKRLQKLNKNHQDDKEEEFDGEEVYEEGNNWKDADEELGEGEEFASDDEEINSDEC